MANNTKEFENYLMQIGKTGQAQQGLQSIQQAGQVAQGLQTAQIKQRKETADMYDKLISSGYEPTQADGSPMTGELVTRMSHGEKIPNVVWNKAKKPEGGGMFGNSQLVSWKDATPEQRRTAIAIAEGRVDPGSQLSFRDRGAATALALEYGEMVGQPPVRAYSAQVKGAAAKYWATGKGGFTATALNTALGHSKSAQEAFKNISNTDVSLLNKPINWLKKNTNDPNVVKLDITLGALAGELATVFKGSAGTDQENQLWLDNLKNTLTPLQAEQALSQVTDLLYSRIGALQYQQSSVEGAGGAPRQLISPKAEKTMKELGGKKQEIKTEDDPFGLFK
jgi:hypothetical protein